MSKLKNKPDKSAKSKSLRKEEKNLTKNEPEDNDLDEDDYFERQREAEKNQKLYV